MPAAEPLTIDAGGVSLRAEMHLPTEQTGVVVIPEVAAAMQDTMLDAVATRLSDAGLGRPPHRAPHRGRSRRRQHRGLRPAPGWGDGSAPSSTGWTATTEPRSCRSVCSGLTPPQQRRSSRRPTVPSASAPLSRRSANRPSPGDDLDRVGAQTLLVVGSGDALSVDGANEAARRLGAVSQVERVESAGSDLRPEQVEAIGTLAVDWFTTHLVTMESPIDVPEPEHFQDMHADRFPPRQGKVKPNH